VHRHHLRTEPVVAEVQVVLEETQTDLVLVVQEFLHQLLAHL
jgi:hypothetical protein